MQKVVERSAFFYYLIPMKSFIIILSITVPLLTLLVLFLLGPRVKVEKPRLTPVVLPAELSEFDGWLAAKEARFPDIIEGGEKTIVWHQNRREKQPYSIVYLHGYTACRQEIFPTADLIAQNMKANLFYTRLTAHGRESGEHYATVTVNDWFNDVYEAVEIGKRLGDRVIIMASSTSAPLTLALLEHFEKETAALVFLSPNFEVMNKSTDLLLLPWSNLILKLAIGDYRVEKHPPSMKNYWTKRYRSEALIQMKAIVHHSSRQDYSHITIPTILLYTENDDTVVPAKSVEFLEKLSSPVKKLVNLEEVKGHIVAGDYCSPQTTKKVVDQITNFLYNAFEKE